MHRTTVVEGECIHARVQQTKQLQQQQLKESQLDEHQLRLPRQVHEPCDVIRDNITSFTWRLKYTA